MRRALLTVAVALVLVLAGCNGGPGGSTAVETTEPTDGDAEETDSEADADSTTDSEDAESGTDSDDTEGTPTEGDASDESGQSDTSDESSPESDVNSTRLLVNHIEAVRGNAAEETTIESDGGTFTFTFTNESGTESFVTVNQTTGERSEWWVSESTTVRRNTSKSPSVAVGTGATSLRTDYAFTSIFLRFVPYSYLNASVYVEDGTAMVDGQQATRYSVEGIRDTATEGRAFNPLSNVTSLSGEILVTDDGIIRSATFESEQRNRDQPVTITYEVLEAGSVSAPRPDWSTGYPQASISTASDRQVLALTHEGGESIPAGTTVQVGSGFIDYGNVTLSESLDSGETLYVTATSGFDAEVSGQIGSQPEVPENARTFSQRGGMTIVLDDVELQFGLTEEQASASDGGF